MGWAASPRRVARPSLQSPAAQGCLMTAPTVSVATVVASTKPSERMAAPRLAERALTSTAGEEPSA